MRTYNYYRKTCSNPHLAYYLQAADKLGIKYKIIFKRTARFEYNNKVWFISYAQTPLPNAISAKFAKKKEFTNFILKNAGIKVPVLEIVKTIKDLKHFYQKWKDIVVKPSVGLGGKGITILPREEELERAYKYAKENMKKGNVLVEKFVQGNNYRILVLKEKVLAVTLRIPANITGDGEKNIKELIMEENKKRKSTRQTSITIDTQVEFNLKKQNLSLKTILPKDKNIKLRLVANLSQGGDIIDQSKDISKYFKDIAIKATKEMGLIFAGVDLITEDITRIDIPYAINEINTNPGLQIHYLAEGFNANKTPIAEQILKSIIEIY